MDEPLPPPAHRRGTVLVHVPGRTRHRRILILVLPIALVVTGTLGYWLIEGDPWTLFDALYMTVITLSTIGYGEVYRLSSAGRVFTIFLVLGGVFTFFYTFTEIVRWIVSGELRDFLGRQAMERTLAQMRDHLIICGYGRMGRLVCQEFSRQQTPFVLIDRNAELLADFSMPFGIALLGDATADEVLKHAGIERARALVTVMASDADNLYTTMSARLLNKNLFIVSRMEDPEAEPKLRRAGANRVVSPYQIGGHRLAQAVLRPTVVDFIELTSQKEHVALQIEETRLQSTSPLVGSTLRDSHLREKLHLIVVAIKKGSGEMIFNPPPDRPLEGGDTLVAIGPRQHLDELEELARGG